MRNKRVLTALLATGLSVGASWFIHATAAEFPTDPPYLSVDSKGNYGVVDPAKLPPTVPVLDAEGNLAGVALSSDVFSDPSSSQGSTTQSTSGDSADDIEFIPVRDDGEYVGDVGPKGFIPAEDGS